MLTAENLDHKMNLILLIATGIVLCSTTQSVNGNASVDQASGGDCSDGKPADVVFVLDASNSIWIPDFWRQLYFVQQMANEFRIGADRTQIALITYADHPIVQFHFNYYHTKSDIMDAIENVRQNGGYETDTAEAIRYMREKVFSPSGGARKNVTKLGLVITDGRSSDPIKTALEAQRARDEGIHMFAVGVGQGLDRLELNAIGSLPTEYYTFTVQSFQGLSNIRHLLAIKACTVTDAPTTISTTTTVASTTTATTTSATTSPVSFGESEDSDNWVYDEQLKKWILRRRRRNESNGYSSGYWSYDDSGRAVWTELQDKPYDDNRNSLNRKEFAEQKLADGLMADDNCRPKSHLDLVFVVDPKNDSISQTHRKQMWELVRDVISHVDMSRDQVRVQFVQSCFKLEEFRAKQSGTHSDRSTNKSHLLSAIDEIASGPKTTAELFDAMLEKLSENSGDGEDDSGRFSGSGSHGSGGLFDSDGLGGKRKRVAVYLTDGPSEDLETTIKAAQEARMWHGVEIFAVGHGQAVNPTELQAIVSCNERDHLFYAQNSHQEQPDAHGASKQKDSNGQHDYKRLNLKDMHYNLGSNQGSKDYQKASHQRRNDLKSKHQGFHDHQSLNYQDLHGTKRESGDHNKSNHHKSNGRLVSQNHGGFEAVHRKLAMALCLL